MFAGRDGSGKSTFKSTTHTELLGMFISPDEIEKNVLHHDFLDFGCHQIQTAE